MNPPDLTPRLVAPPPLDHGSTTDGGPPRLAVRSPLEMYLWIFISRLVAILLAPRSSTTSTEVRDPSPPPPNAAATATAAATGTGTGTADPATELAAHAHGPRPDRRGAGRPDAAVTARASGTVALTAATGVAAVAAFALGRRRGRR